MVPHLGGGDITSGSTATLTAKPSIGETLINWTQRGIIVSTESTFTTPAITSDITYTANFNITQFTATFTNSIPTTILLSWQEIPQATLYKIYRDNVFQGTTTSTTYEAKNLPIDNQYQFTIVASDDSGNTLSSSPLTAATPKETQLQSANDSQLILVSPDGYKYFDTSTKTVKELVMEVIRNQQDIESIGKKAFIVKVKESN